MPPTPDELSAINVVLDHLSQGGSRWQVQNYLDDALPNEPSPEAIVTSGVLTAAVEIKRLIVHGDFFGLKEGLECLLMPAVAGHFLLVPPFGYALPWTKEFIRSVGQDLERSAKQLRIGESGFVRVARRANIVASRQYGSIVYCNHGAFSFRDVAGSVPGVFYLVDSHQQHSFVTDQGEAEFRERVRAGCERRAAGNVATVEWFEEWRIQRLVAERSRVEIVMPTPVFEVQATIDERLWLVLESGGRKFRTRRADSNILVIDNRFTFADADRVAAAIERARDGDWVSLVDVVFLLDAGACVEVFRAD